MKKFILVEIKASTKEKGFRVGKHTYTCGNHEIEIYEGEQALLQAVLKKLNGCLKYGKPKEDEIFLDCVKYGLFVNEDSVSEGTYHGIRLIFTPSENKKSLSYLMCHPPETISRATVKWVCELIEAAKNEKTD